MFKRTLLELAASVTLGVNYAAAYIITYLWNVPTLNLELATHLSIVFGASLLFGILIADFRKTIVYTVVSIVIGLVIATIVIILPPLLLAQGAGAIDFYLSAGLTELSRLFIIGVSFVILGMLLGCFIAETMK